MLSPSQTPYYRSILPGKVGCSEVSSSIRLSYRHRVFEKCRTASFLPSKKDGPLIPIGKRLRDRSKPM